MVINIIVIIAFVLLAAVQLHLDKKEAARHKEAARRSEEMRNSIDDFTHAITKLEITEAEFNSMRRWMRGTMNALRHHEEKLDDHKKKEEPEQIKLFKD